MLAGGSGLRFFFVVRESTGYMLSVSNIAKSFGPERVLSKVNFTVNGGERLGLVGPNGCGKTTLLRIIMGLEKPDAGGFHFTPSSLRVGYLPQGFTYPPAETIGSFVARMAGDLPALTAELEDLAPRLTNPAQQQRYDDVLHLIQEASENVGRVPAVLAALGVADLPPDQLAQQLSGGQKTRLALAGVLISNPQLLILDEPTNHLDLGMLEWLENWLLGFRGGVLLVSHDRALLDQVATGILELDPLTHALRAYAGNYADYLEQKLVEREHQWQAFQDQQVEIARLEQSARNVRNLARFRKGGKADTGDKFAKGFFANRSLGTMRRAKALEARLEYLRTEGRVDRPSRTWQMKVAFGDTLPSGKDVLATEDLAVGYSNGPLLSGLNLRLHLGERVALIGPNGCGKTTLLRTISGALPPLAGQVRLGVNVRLGYLRQEQEDLDPTLNALETIQRLAGFPETEARQFLSLYLFTQDDVFTPVGCLSYGERARLSLAALVVSGCNFLLLDEPINHLDIPSRARFEQALTAFEGTALAVVHDRYFIDGFASTLWQVENHSIRVIHGPDN
jgi:ATP-binding cassette subfamily F protein 3